MGLFPVIFQEILQVVQVYEGMFSFQADRVPTQSSKADYCEQLHQAAIQKIRQAGNRVVNAGKDDDKNKHYTEQSLNLRDNRLPDRL